MKIVLVVAVTSLLLCTAHCQSQFLGYAQCSQIQEEQGKKFCLDYINSNSADVKYSTAVLWSKYKPDSFSCANITWTCLVSDMRAQAFGSACTAASDGSPCRQDSANTEGSCWHGLCGDPAQVAVNMLLDKDSIQASRMRVSSNSNMRLGSNTDINQQPQRRSSNNQQQLAYYNRRVAAPIMMPNEGKTATLLQAPASAADADSYDYDTLSPRPPTAQQPPTSATNNGNSNLGAPGPPADDPYGLNVQLPDSSLISSPFEPPTPPSPSPRPPAPPPAPPAVQRAQLTMDIQPDSFIGSVPASFIGVSKEWGPQVYYDRNLDAFGNIFAELGPSPIIRIGGFSQESLLRPPNSTYLDSLKTLHCQLGIRFIIGLPLFQNAPELGLAVKKTFDEAFQDYPYAILSYELGNEPNFWPGTGAGGVSQISGPTSCIPVQYNDPSYQLVGTMDTPTDKPGGVDGYALYTDYKQPYVPYKASQYCFTPQQLLFVQGIPSYQNFFQTTARSLTGCGGAPASNLQALWGFPNWGPPGFNRQVITGPAWGDFASFDRNSLIQFLQNSAGCYLDEASIHYYGPFRDTTYDALFSKLTGVPNTAPDPANRPLIDIVKDYVDTARQANVGLRISESNSVPDGGQSNFSNTLGAALWTLVTALEFAKAGTTGINFHWGNGGVPNNPGAAPAYIGVQALFDNNDPNKPYPSVRIPWYGYLMFSRTLGNNGPGMFLNYTTNVLSPGNVCNTFVYPYTLLVPHAGMISVVVVNANPNVTCDFTATLPGVVTTAAILQRLEGPQGLQSVPGVTLAGQTYQGTTNGKMTGVYKPEIIQPHQETIRTTGWTFTITPGSGVLVQIPLSGGATNRLGYPPVTADLVNGGAQQAAPASSAAYKPPQGVSTTPPAGQAAAAQQMQQAAAAAPGGPTSSTIPAVAGVPSTDDSSTAAAPGSTMGLADGAGRYVLKGYAADGSPIYTWLAAAGSSYETTPDDGSAVDQQDPAAASFSSGNLGPGFGQQVSVAALAGPRNLGLGRSSGSSTSKPSKPSGLGGLFGGLFGRSGRRLMGSVDRVLPTRVRSLLQWAGDNYKGTYGYSNPGTMGGVSPYQTAAPASAASQYGVPAPSGLGRILPQNANTSNLDVGLYGLGGYTLLPPGYNETAMKKAAAQCPGIARIMAVQSMAASKKKL